MVKNDEVAPTPCTPLQDNEQWDLAFFKVHLFLSLSLEQDPCLTFQNWELPFKTVPCPFLTLEAGGGALLALNLVQKSDHSSEHQEHDIMQPDADSLSWRTCVTASHNMVT